VREPRGACWVRGRVVASPRGAMYRHYAARREIGGASLMSDPRDINRDAK
jgi:hypothetical protein